MGKQIENYYSEEYSSSDFQEVYLYKRNALYNKILRIITALSVKHAVDIGCSYGLLVALLNSAGINAWGIDFDIQEIKEKHKKLKCSDKFLYGNIGEDLLLSGLDIPEKNSAILLLDTLRYIENPHKLNPDTEYLIIKEVSNNASNIKERKNQNDFHLYSPTEYTGLFSSYKPLVIYSSKFIFKFTNPNAFILWLINKFFPSYVLILKRK